MTAMRISRWLMVVVEVYGAVRVGATVYGDGLFRSWDLEAVSSMNSAAKRDGLCRRRGEDVKEDSSIPQRSKAMELEYNALLDNKTWSLTILPTHRKITGCK
ncbi:hypothetical protein KIW84_024679 [Lathyrus oleraceus]|uniref:Uncharacterized protein n=1 Tax=Pisum sativum TaxID=3888 RepID=A0A9D4YG84_PEA|nr:hypothetical protein KIW84_024679 [Pisum sativum]